MEASPLQRDVFRGHYESFLEGSSSFMVPRLPHALQATRSRLQAPYQYALPLHRSSRFSSNGPGSPSSQSSSSQGAEHILRRKTPNGTLAAGYDGRSIEWTSEPHAVKHMLLPLPDKSNQPRIQSCLTSRSNRSTPLGHPSVTSVPSLYPRLDGAEMAPPPPPPQVTVSSDGVTGQQQQQQQLNSWQALSPQYARGIDSLINQGTMLQESTYYSPNGAQLPAILQPLYQPCPGPTASNSVAPYGPYWPDGAFIPYRPAALRDSRYQPGHGGSDWVDGVSSAHLGFGSHPASQPSITPYPDDQTPAAGLYPIITSINPSSLNYIYGASSSHLPLGHVHENASNAQTHGCHSLDRRLNHQLYSDPTSSSRGIPSRGNSTYISQNAEAIPKAYSSPAPNTAERQPLANASDWRSNSYQFKDKLLAWAHGVYVDLLASVHQARSSVHRHSVDGTRTQQRLPKTGIFPKPPRQPSFNISLSQPHSTSQWEDDSPNSSSALDEIHSNLKQQPGWPHADNQLRSQTSKHVPSIHAGSTMGGGFESRTVRPSSGELNPFPVLYEGMLILLTGTVMSNAMTALELISRLCAESAWAWIDGMLLAGCLAYGLGNYNDALTWYSKILEMDTKSVEYLSQSICIWC